MTEQEQGRGQPLLCHPGEGVAGGVGGVPGLGGGRGDRHAHLGGPQSGSILAVNKANKF